MAIVRRLMDWELSKYRDHLLKLDDESKYLRFAHKIKDEGIISFVDRIQTKLYDHKIFVIEDDDLNVIGVGHVSLEGGKTELAFSVLKEHQGNGYGNALVNKCIEWCQNRNIKHGYMVCLQSNEAMRHLAKKNGLQLHNEYGETTADIDMPAATPGTILHEAIESSLASVDYLNKATVKIANSSIRALLFTYKM